jgi:quinol-cytochrome oxidoreductase complex cytochrome b subunit
VKASRIAIILNTSAAALFLEFALQVAAGIYLSRAYVGDPKHAHESMVRILSATPHSQISAFHYWGSAFMLAHSFLHVCIMLFSGAFRPPNQWRWFGALAFFLCAFLFQATGNLLPYDQHGVQTAAVEGGIAASVPMGQSIAAIMLGGEPSVNSNTLGLWYMAHRLLIPIALLLGTMGSLAAILKRPSGKPVWALSAVLALIPLVLGLSFGSPLGTAATEADYNKFGAMVSWYTWPLHGSLEAFNKISPSLGWVGTAVVPTLFALFLLAAPFMSKRIANAGIQGTFIAFMVFFFGSALLFGGGFAPLTGTRDPVTAKAEPPSTTPASPIDSTLAAKGRDLFNSEGCAGCHGTDGLKPSGGPKLDQVFKDHADAEWYIAFIKNPKSMKPSSTMPPYPDLTIDQLKAMAEFLRQPR